jgi:dihydrolipoamide dehydrogenase
LLWAIGRTPHTIGLGLQDIGVELGKDGAVMVGDDNQSSVPSIYAVGDVTNRVQLTPIAIREGHAFADSIFGNNPRTVNYECIPTAVFSNPPIASVGLTEAKAKEAGYEVRVGNFRCLGNGKALALGEAEGFIKTVFDAKTGELLGAHMVGAEVTELIQGYTIGKTAELVEADFMHTVFPHPTLSEMMHESVLGAYGKMLHM